MAYLQKRGKDLSRNFARYWHGDTAASGRNKTMENPELLETAQQLRVYTVSVPLPGGSWNQPDKARNAFAGRDETRQQCFIYCELQRRSHGDPWMRNLVYYKEGTTFCNLDGYLTVEG